MKENLKRFIQTKKELIVFVGLLSLAFIAVIAIAEISIFNTPNDSDDVVVTPPTGDDGDEDVTPPTVVKYEFSLPTLTTKVIIRDFYNKDEMGSNDNAIIETSNGFVQSRGLSFASDDNSAFDVVTIYPGKVLSVENDEVMGTTVKVDHGDDVISVYSSLASTNLSVGDTLDVNDIIGVAGTSAYDLNAGVHVHVQVISTVNNKDTYINLNDIVGKTIDDIASSIK